MEVGGKGGCDGSLLCVHVTYSEISRALSPQSKILRDYSSVSIAVMQCDCILTSCKI